MLDAQPIIDPHHHLWDLGRNTSLILRNHGLLTVGRTIADAFLAMFTLESACEIQVLAQAGAGELISVDPHVLSGVRASVDKVTRGGGGALAWPGLLRRLDRIDASYKS